MNINGNTILITGGGSGIGLALAERFLREDNEVIIVGRREKKLSEAQEKYPELHIKQCDVADQKERETLFNWVTSHFPDLNVLVNNAGMQQRVNLKEENDWAQSKNELTINIDGPLHLSMLFTPFLKSKPDASIINITSGLALSPGAWVPVYSATKAALSSFTQSLRLQLENTDLSVIEVLPPAVNTDLGGVGLHTFGAPLDDFADTVFEELKEGKIEIAYGDSAKRLHASRDELKEGSKQAWQGFKKNNPGF